MEVVVLLSTDAGQTPLDWLGYHAICQRCVVTMIGIDIKLNLQYINHTVRCSDNQKVTDY